MCKCVETLDRLLAPHNTHVEPIVTLGRAMGVAIGIRTTKIDSKKRGSARTVVATFCPFCGKLIQGQGDARS